MNKEPTIKILVGYHKPAVLLKSDVLVPIHLGRALACEASKDGVMSQADYQWMLGNMIGDDTGDNISDKNRLYAELTGVYWAWKNYDKLSNPDYIGFMHYRRFFNNENTNITELSIDDYKFSFNGNDFDIYTPIPSEENPYEHIKKSDIMNVDEYNRIIDIAQKIFPEFVDAITKYNEGNKTFYYNMFIMKKETFFEYCSFIFPILISYIQDSHFYNLKKIDQNRNLARYGEWLTGIFFTKCSQYKKINNLGVTFIKNTELPLEINKAFSSQSIPIVFATDTNYYMYLGVAIQSLIKHKNAETKYDIIILEMDLDEYKKVKLENLSTENVSVRVFNIKNIIQKYKISNFMTINHIKESAYYRLLISEILTNYEKVIYLDCDLVVLTDLIELYETELKDNYAAVVEDLLIKYTFSKNENFVSYMNKVLNIEDLNYYFNSGVILFNLDLMRKNKVLPELLKTAERNNQYFHDQNVLNAVFYKKVIFLDNRYNVNYHLIFSQKGDEYPKEVWDKYISWLKNPKILHYTSREKPWQNPSLPFTEHFWQYARQTPFYEEIIYNNLKKPAAPNDNTKELLRDVLNYSKIRFNYYRCKLLANLTLGGGKATL